jgi:PAS domain S-box-containing protein
MPDQPKTHQNLIMENAALRERIRELEAAEAERRQAEKVLRDSERLYRSLIECSSDAIFCVDKQGQYQFVNTLFSKTFGKSPDYFKGKTFWDIYPKEHADYRFKTTQRVIQTGESESIEVEVPLPDKTLFFYATANPIRDDTGSVVMVLTHAVDITERKLAERQLQQSRQRVQLALDGTEQGLWEFDLSTKKVHYGDNWSKILGFGSEESIFDYEWYVSQIHPASLPGFEKAISDCLSGKVDYIDWEYQIRDKSGQWQWVHALGTFTEPDERGIPTKVIGTHRNITPRKRAEEALRVSEARYSMLAEHMTEAVWLMGTDLKLKYLSPSLERMRGYTLGEIGRLPLEKHLAPESLKLALEVLADETPRVLADPAYTPKRTLELEFLRKDGTTFWSECTLTLIRDKEGKPQSILGEGRDITERKRAEEERKKLKEQLDRAQKLESIGTLAGGIAHDFNNLLMGIQGQASMMMLDLDVSHPHHARLKSIEEQVQSCSDLTQQLLGFARGGRYAVRPTNMNEIVEKTSGMFGRTKKEITIHRQYGKALWNVEIDRTQMEQVMMNLYVNAWHAMPGGGELSLETDNVFLADRGEGFPAPGRYVRITVSDTGMGMDAQTRERIFDPFFTTKGMGRGTGLGLATVYGIIQGHKGMIDVTSEPGCGTTFEIYLPATDKAIVREPSGGQEVCRGTGTILLVDDERMVLNVARQMLEYLGYRVHCVGCGQEAVALYHEKKDEIDLVILDMIMPGMSGGATFDHLKQANPQIRVLLSSGYSIDGEARGILNRGCRGFLQKPFHVASLSSKVREVLGD